jgi:hypothetical protein
MSDVKTVAAQEAWIKARQAIALPVYTVALVLDYLGAALGRLGAWIAGDHWPR